MASTFAVTRNHLIFGLCLPLAVLLGYMLADIEDPASRLVVLIALGVLAVPILMRWHHVLLILSWNMVAQPAIPGSPHLWSLVAILSLLFAVLNRSVNPEYEFALVPALTRPMVAFVLVVLGTAFLTGGIGLRIFGSSSVGGRGYYYLLTAIAGFFALSSQPIPPQRAPFYAALFFLPGMTAMAGQLAGWAGPKAGFVFLLFPGGFADEFVMDPTLGAGVGRVAGLVAASLAVYCWLMARYGITGIFDLSRPWRLILFLSMIVAMCFGGFRTGLVLMATIFFLLYSLENLWRTRLTLVLAGLCLSGGVFLLAFAQRLPLPVQRAISFLPIQVDAMTKEMADNSTQWRIDMWKAVLPEVPKYLLIGKGYSYSADDLFMTQMQSIRGGTVSYEEAAFAGDYHNGPLSVVIPFGIAGVMAFVWLLVASARYMYTKYREGDPALRQINTFLLALFLARVLFFCLLFGSLYSELFYFTGLIGFSVALNRAARTPATGAEPETASAEVA